jgi:HD-like signal output (HDOD) protein
MSRNKYRSSFGGYTMKNWMNDEALVQAIEVDADSLVVLLFELARRDDAMASHARETAEALMRLLDSIAGEDESREAGEEA